MIVNTQPRFIKQLRIQARVVWALIMREMITRYGREGIGIIWLIAEPAMFVVGVMLIFSNIPHKIFPGTSIAEFLAVSYPTLLLWRNGTNQVTKALDVNRALLHHRPVRPIDIIYSRIILEFTSTTASSLFLYFIFVSFGICQWPADLYTMLIGYIMVVWFAFSFVIMMSALSELSESVERTSHIILYLMLPFSGVFLPAALVPEDLREYLLLLPLVNAVEWFHHGYYGNRLPTYYHAGYTVVSLIFMTIFSFMLMKIAIRKVQMS